MGTVHEEREEGERVVGGMEREEGEREVVGNDKEAGSKESGRKGGSSDSMDCSSRSQYQYARHPQDITVPVQHRQMMSQGTYDHLLQLL